jgi:hypothetical protein
MAARYTLINAESINFGPFQQPVKRFLWAQFLQIGIIENTEGIKKLSDKDRLFGESEAVEGA